MQEMLLAMSDRRPVLLLSLFNCWKVSTDFLMVMSHPPFLAPGSSCGSRSYCMSRFHEAGEYCFVATLTHSRASPAASAGVGIDQKSGHKAARTKEKR